LAPRCGDGNNAGAAGHVEQALPRLDLRKLHQLGGRPRGHDLDPNKRRPALALGLLELRERVGFQLSFHLAWRNAAGSLSRKGAAYAAP
jgi:hypothetical protein